MWMSEANLIKLISFHLQGVPGIELRSPGLLGTYLYPLSHLASPTPVTNVTLGIESNRENYVGVPLALYSCVLFNCY